MINWQTILTSILCSGTITTLIILFFKKIIERGIDSKFNTLENKERLLFEEDGRRAGKIFDDQYEAYKAVIAIVYRIRNESRHIVGLLNENEFNLEKIKVRKVILEEYYKVLHRLRYDNRVILGDVFWNEFHSLQNPINFIINFLEIFIQEGSSTNREEIEELIKRIKHHNSDIDEHYLRITEIAQTILQIGKIR